MTLEESLQISLKNASENATIARRQNRPIIRKQWQLVKQEIKLAIQRVELNWELK